MKQDDMEKEKKKCSGTYLEDSHSGYLSGERKRRKRLLCGNKEETRRIYNRGLSETSGR